MVELFTALTRAIGGTPAIALSAAFVWGLLSVVLSPCHMASIPLIVGYVGQQGRTTVRRSFVISLLFAIGILLSIYIIGEITTQLGRMVGDLGPIGNYVVAGIFFIVGLHLLDVIPNPWSAPGKVGMKRKGLLAAFILGLIFGIALGPCTFAYMIPVIEANRRAAAAGMLWYGRLIMLTYAVGHCAVLVLAGTSTELVQKYLNWNEKSKGTIIVKRVCGVLILIGGVYLIYLAN